MNSDNSEIQNLNPFPYVKEYRFIDLGPDKPLLIFYCNGTGVINPSNKDYKKVFGKNIIKQVVFESLKSLGFDAGHKEIIKLMEYVKKNAFQKGGE